MQPDMTPFNLNKGCQVLEVESKLQQTIECFPEVSQLAAGLRQPFSTRLPKQAWQIVPLRG